MCCERDIININYTHCYKDCLLFFCLPVSLLPTHVITCIPPYRYDNTCTIGGCCECVLHILRDYPSAVANTLMCCWDYRSLGPPRTDDQTPVGSRLKRYSQSDVTRFKNGHWGLKMATTVIRKRALLFVPGMPLPLIVLAMMASG